MLVRNLLILAAAGVGAVLVAVQGGNASSDPNAPAAATAAPPPAPTQASEPIDIIPADAMLTWYGRPFPDAPKPGEGAAPIAAWLQLVRSWSGLKPVDKFRLRVLEFCGQMIRYRHAITLIDTSARQEGALPDSMKLDKLRLALIVETNGEAGPFKRIVSEALKELTGQNYAKLQRKSAHGVDYHELYDNRLPAWARFAWGEVGNFFVVTIGPSDVFERIAAMAADPSLSIGGDEWFRHVRGERGAKASIEVVVGADRMRERLDPLLQGRVTDFFTAWDAADMHRAHWAIGLEDQSLYCSASFVLGDQTVERIYADARNRDPNALRAIPADARHAIFTLPAGPFFVDLVQGIYAWQPQRVQQEAARRWAGVQRAQGFDAETQLLAHLGDTLILHNKPAHPLKLPIFFTTLVEIADNPAEVRATMDKMCKSWRIVQEREAADPNAPDQPIKIDDDGDGIWYLQFGIIQGVAWKVTDRYIVISYSPAALRQYLETAADAVGQ